MKRSLELHHVGFVVRNMDRAIEGYVREGATLEIAPVDDPIQRVTCALMRMEDGGAIELVAPIDPEDSPVSSRLRRGGGLDHLCYLVDDLQFEISVEVERGGTVVCDPVYAITFHRMIAFVLRRTGLLVELMERNPT